MALLLRITPAKVFPDEMGNSGTRTVQNEEMGNTKASGTEQLLEKRSEREYINNNSVSVLNDKLRT